MSHFTAGGYPNFDPYYISSEEEQRVIERENETKETRRCKSCMTSKEMCDLKPLGIQQCCDRCSHG